MKTPSPNLLQRIEDLINFDKRMFFVLLVLIFLIIRYLTDLLILQAIPGYRSLDQDGVFTYFYIFNTLNYLWTPFGLIWKFTLISFTLWIGTFMAGVKLSYKTLWQFAMIAEIIFIFPELIRLLWFLTVEAESFLVIKNFHPLSLFSLVNPDQVAQKFHYPLAALNLFEVAYWFLLGLGVHLVGRRNYISSLLIVLSSYTLCFFLWLGFYMIVYK